MPKQKTRKGAAKRFRITGTGKIRRKKANKRHLLTGKSRKRKRQLGAPVLVAPADSSRIRKQLYKG
jgi:large subunit ribosomal protein L35